MSCSESARLCVDQACAAQCNWKVGAACRYMPRVRESAVHRGHAVDWMRSGDPSMDASSEAEPCTCGFSACRKHCDARRSSRESLLTREGTQPIEFSHASGVLQTFVGSADRVHCQSEPPGHKVVADMLLSMLPVPTLSLEGPPAMASTCSCPLLFPGGPPSGNCPHMPQACSSLDPNDPTLFIGSTTDPFRQPYTPEQRWRFLASHMRQHGAGAMYAADRDRRRGLPTLHSPQISLTGAQLRETAATEDRLSSVARHSLGSSGSGRITSSGGDFQCGKCFACKQGASLLGAGECSKRQSLCLRSISTRPSRSAADQSSSHFPQKITIEDRSSHVVDKMRTVLRRLMHTALCKGPLPIM